MKKIIFLFMFLFITSFVFADLKSDYEAHIYAYYRMNNTIGSDNDDITDTMGTFPFTVNGVGGSNQWGEGVLGTAMHFDGTGDYRGIGIDDTLDATMDSTDDFSVEFIFNSSTNSEGQVIFQKNPQVVWFNFGGTGAEMHFEAAGDTCSAGIGCTGNCSAMSPNTWYHIVGTYSATDGHKLYVDGILCGSAAGTVLREGDTTDRHGTIGSNYGPPDGSYATPLKGSLDNLIYHNKTLTNVEVIYSYNSGTYREYFIPSVGDTSPPSIIFDSKSPDDLSTFNAVTLSINVNYTITDDTGVDADSVILEYKTNDSVKDWFMSLNGSVSFGFQNITALFNDTSTFNFKIDEDVVLPSIYNIDFEFMEDEPHLIYELDSSNEWLKTEFFNLSPMDRFIGVELMCNNSDNGGTQSLPLYYCNSSYTTGNPSNSDNCFNYFNIEAQTPYSHKHTDFQSDMITSFIVTNGQVGNVGITPTSYILINGRTSVNAWDCYYIPNSSRPVSEFSTNNGVTYTTLDDFTPAIHLHPFSQNSTFVFRSCANDTLNNYGCSTYTTDLFNFDTLKPSAPIVFSPVSRRFNNTLLINYTESQSVFTTIAYYNITLVDLDEVLVFVIVGNNSNLTSFLFDTNNVIDGDYRIRVTAHDNNTLTNFGLSVNFTIDNTAPSQSWTMPLIDNSTSVFVNESLSLNSLFTDSNTVFGYNISIWYSDGSLFTTLIATNLDTTSYTLNTTITPDRLGTYLLRSSVFDAHTTLAIKDYEYEEKVDGIIFDFTKDKYGYMKDTVNITDKSVYPLLDIGANKTADRYKFYFRYDTTLSKSTHIWLKYRLQCDDLHLVENSGYNAHFVCYEDRKWVDFENKDIEDTIIQPCGLDCYDISIYTTNKDLIIYNSIGDLNEGIIDLNFEVTGRPAGIVDMLRLNVCQITSTPVAIMYIFLFAILLLAWYVFKFQVKIGIVTLIADIGFVFFGLSLVACSPVVGVILCLMGIALGIVDVTEAL